jgi:TfoX/Sxy family transcriptional regulator of competence genes
MLPDGEAAMEWKKVSAELCDIIDAALSSYDCSKRMMFGCPAYFINNNMFAGVQADNIFIRLSEQDRNEIFLSCDEVSIFEPAEGRQMKEYVVLPEPVYSDREVLEKWLARSYIFTKSLIPKEPKKKKAR